VRNTLSHRPASILRRSCYPLTGDFACPVRKNPMKSRQRNERRGNVPPLAPSPIGLPGPNVSIGCKMRCGLGVRPHLRYWICKLWNGWNEPLRYCKRTYKEMKLEATYYSIPLWLLRLRNMINTGRRDKPEGQMHFDAVIPRIPQYNGTRERNPQYVDLYVLDEFGHPHIAKHPPIEEVISKIDDFNRSFSGLEGSQIAGDKSSALSLL
jgi:hypothetical protein